MNGGDRSQDVVSTLFSVVNVPPQSSDLVFVARTVSVLSLRTTESTLCGDSRLVLLFGALLSVPNDVFSLS